MGGPAGGPVGGPGGLVRGAGGPVGRAGSSGGGALGEGAVAETIKDSLKRIIKVTGCERCS